MFMMIFSLSHNIRICFTRMLVMQRLLFFRAWSLLICLLLCFLMVPGLRAQHANVFISDNNSPEEPTIFIDPANTDHIIAGANISRYYHSHDGGFSWAEGSLYSTYGAAGDPCVIVDTAGTAYIFHLSSPDQGYWLDRIVCQKSTDHGQSWNNGSYMGHKPSAQQDKEWAVVDPATNNIYVSWTQFDSYGSHEPDDKTNIMFSRSLDEGQSWMPAIQINEVSGDCIDSDNTVEGAVPCVGPEGQVYVSWAGPEGIVFDRSLDGGLSWLDEDIFVDEMPGGWDMTIPGISRANGLPVTRCDLSTGPTAEMFISTGPTKETDLKILIYG